MADDQRQHAAAMKARYFFISLLASAVLAFLSWKYVLRSAVDTPSVVTQIQRLNQLVTVRYSIQRVVGMREAKEPFGSESILLMVQGEAKAGIDLQKLSARDVEITSDGSVIVALPPAKLTDVYLDEKQIKVWDRSVTWWTPWVPFNPDLEHKARLQAVDDVRAAALQMGILGQAQRSAEVAIRELLGAMRLKVKYKSAD